MDFREIDSRAEAFLTWYEWGLRNNDVDSSIYLCNYLMNRFEHNYEQVLWICWIYGTTYQLATTWVIWNEFPDFHLVDRDRLKEWNDKNYHRLRYQTDTKWNKGKLPEMFDSYAKFIGDKTQREVIEGIADQGFNKLWDAINCLHKFGRYSSWFYIQFLKHVGGINIDANDLKLNDLNGSRSHRTGLMYAIGWDSTIDRVPTDSDLVYLNTRATALLSSARERFGELEPDYFSMETALCSFKKLFRTRDGRYNGYYLDRQAEDIRKVELDRWDGIDWLPLWQGREETIDPRLISTSINKSKMKLFLATGKMHHMELLKGNEQPPLEITRRRYMSV